MSPTFEPALIIAGLALCLFGWVLYWAGLRLLGAMCGAIAVAALAAIVILFGGWQDRWVWIISCAVAAVIGAIVGVFLITRAHYFLFFVTGALVGAVAAWAIQASFAEWVESHVSGSLGHVLYYVAFTLAGGLLVLLAHRMIVVALTAFFGTVLFTLGVPSRYAVWLFLPLFFGSLLVQTGILRTLGEPAKPAPKPPPGPPTK